MAEDDEEDEGAVEAIIDRGETRSMIHVDLADAEDLGQYNISRLLVPRQQPPRSLSML